MNTTLACTAILMLATWTADPVDPATLTDKVTIAVGKKLLVQFERKGDALSRPQVVEKVLDEPPTVTFDFLKQGDMLILATKNPFPKDLKFRALARVKGRKAPFETSIVPVKAGLLGFELWQDPIEELILFEFTLIDEKP